MRRVLDSSVAIDERMTDEDERARDGFVRGVGFGFEG